MKTIKVNVADLKQHPLQYDVYGDLTDIEFKALKADIARVGVLQPPEISVDRVIIDGHQRINACKDLGIVQIEVLVHEDLDGDQVDERFVRANLDRRQLDPVAKARAYKALFEVERKRQGRQLHPETDLEFRDFVAENLGISERTVDRHLKLLRLPRAIQDAVSAGELGMIKAIKVCSFTATKMQELEKRFAEGETVKSVIVEMTIKKKTPKTAQVATEPVDRYHVLFDFLVENLDELEE